MKLLQGIIIGLAGIASNSLARRRGWSLVGVFGGTMLLTTVWILAIGFPWERQDYAVPLLAGAVSLAADRVWAWWRRHRADPAAS